MVPLLDEAFSSYTFTDSSNDDFSEVKNKLKDYAGRMIFETLDLQKSLSDQGFVERRFDLVVAAHVDKNFATDEVAATSLKNIRDLLKPGGQFLLSVRLSDSEPGDHGSPDSDVALDRWETRLRRHGFSGIDTSTLRSFDGHPFAIIASQAVDEYVNLLRNPLQDPEKCIAESETLTVIGGSTSRTQKLVKELISLLQPRFKQQINLIDSMERLLRSDHDLDTMSSILCVTDLDEPFLKNFTAEKLDTLKRVFQQAKSVLWVCQGARHREPYAAMMFGLSRTIRAEYSSLNLQMLDVDMVGEEKMMAERIASVFLRLQIWDSWAASGTQQDIAWSVERELILEKGRISIPRLYPKKYSNFRYNTARRKVLKEVDPQKVPIQLGQEQGASLSRTMMPVPQEVPRLQIPPTYSSLSAASIRVTHSVFPFIRIDGVGSVMLCAGTAVSTGASVFGLGFSAESPAPTVPAWIVRHSDLKLDQVDGLVQLASSLVAQQILSRASSALALGETLVVHDAGAALAQALQRGAKMGPGFSLILTSSSTSERDDIGENVIRIHPELSKFVVHMMIPRSTALFIDLSTTETGVEFGDSSRVIRGCLPPNCNVLGRRHFYNSAARSFYQKSIVQHGKLALQVAVEDICSLRPTPPRREPITLPLSKLTNTPALELDSSPDPTVLDWTERSTPIEMQPVDEGAIFDADKTYVLVGLAGELGQSLAEWMIHHGARNIVLSSRRPVVDPRFLEALSKEWGAVVKVMALSVLPLIEVDWWERNS